LIELHSDPRFVLTANRPLSKNDFCVKFSLDTHYFTTAVLNRFNILGLLRRIGD
jgi:hypothetical protein